MPKKKKHLTPPDWWARWEYLATELIKDKKAPDPETDIDLLQALAANNEKDISTVLRQALNFLLGHNADGEKKYRRARSFIANQFNLNFGGVPATQDRAVGREWNDLDRRIAIDMTALAASREESRLRRDS